MILYVAWVYSARGYGVNSVWTTREAAEKAVSLEDGDEVTEIELDQVNNLIWEDAGM